MINGKTFDLQTVNADDDAALYNEILSDGVLAGCDVTCSGTTINISAGYFISCGRVVQITGSHTITPASIPSSGYVRLKFVVDTSETNTEAVFAQGYFETDVSATISGFTSLQQNIVSGNDIYHEIEFCMCSASGGTMTDVYRQMENAHPKNTYIVESGTSDDWTYKKWSDGTAECWCSVTVNSAASDMVAWSGTDFYFISYSSKSYPFTFVDLPIPVISFLSDNGNFAFVITGSTDTTQIANRSQTGRFGLARPGAAALKGAFKIQVNGRWK